MKSMEDREQRKFIGAGTFGEVWTMKLKGQSPTFVQKISRNVTNDIYGIQQEILILSTFIDFHYIPKLIYAGYTADSKWCTIMEYFTGGTLDYHSIEEIKRHNANIEPKINFEQKKYIAYHLARAIEELHSMNYTHGLVSFI